MTETAKRDSCIGLRLSNDNGIDVYTAFFSLYPYDVLDGCN